MELKDLSTNWKTLQASLRVGSVNANSESKVRIAGKQHGVKRKSFKSNISSDLRQSKKLKRSSKMGEASSKTHYCSEKKNDSSNPASGPSSQRSSTAAARINEGFSQT